MNKRSIWIADDDPDDRMIIKEAFEEHKYAENLCFFEDGEKVLIKMNNIDLQILENFPSLLILDLNMPRVNGIELLKHLKSKEITKLIPIVILSTSKSNSDKDKAMELGADDFITKPFSFDLMLKITKELIEKYG